MPPVLLQVLPIFEKIGTVFLFARSEFACKLETIAAVSVTHPTLDAVVAAGKADGSITVKNSPARNVHRMMCTLSFIAAIFENLMAPQGMTLKEAVSEAYDRTLGQLHAWVRRGRVTGAVVVGQGR